MDVEERISLERSIATTAEAVVNISKRSDERMDYLKERFDDMSDKIEAGNATVTAHLNYIDEKTSDRISRIEDRIEKDEAKRALMKRLWVPFALTCALTVGGMFKSMYFDTLASSVQGIDRRLHSVESKLNSIIVTAEPK